MLQLTIIGSAVLIATRLSLVASLEQPNSVTASEATPVDSQCRSLVPDAEKHLDPRFWTIRVDVNNTGNRAMYFGEKSSDHAILIHRQAVMGPINSFFGLKAEDIEMKIEGEVFTAREVISNFSVGYVIIVLSKPVNLDKKVEPLPLPATGIPFAGCTCLHTVTESSTGITRTSRVKGGPGNQLICPVRDSGSRYVLASDWLESVKGEKINGHYRGGFASMDRDVEWIAKQIADLVQTEPRVRKPSEEPEITNRRSFQLDDQLYFLTVLR